MIGAQGPPHTFGITVRLGPLHDDATIDEAVAALAREPGGLFDSSRALGSVPLEVRVTRRWREPDSNSLSLNQPRSAVLTPNATAGDKPHPHAAWSITPWQAQP